MAKTRREVLAALGGLALAAPALAQMGQGQMGTDFPGQGPHPPEAHPLGGGHLRLLRHAHQDPGGRVAGAHFRQGLL
jgi:hypothetical protein